MYSVTGPSPEPLETSAVLSSRDFFLRPMRLVPLILHLAYIIAECP